MKSQLPKRLHKKVKKGFRGYPVGTLAFYGPDNRFASKLAASVILGEDEDPAVLERWYSDIEDVRESAVIGGEGLAFFERHGGKSVAMTDRILGCPHEDGIDYDGPTCPRCPFWAGRDRFTHERVE
jgi:hypothetical protein